MFLGYVIRVSLTRRVGEHPFSFVERGSVGAFDSLAVGGFHVDVGLDGFSQLAGLGGRDGDHSHSAATG